MSTVTQQTLTIAWRTLLLLMLIVGAAMVFSTPASALSDDSSGGGSWTPPGSGGGGGGTRCVAGDEVRDGPINNGRIIVDNSPLCWGATAQPGNGYISTGYEVWRFYRSSDNGGAVTWSRGRVNLSNWSMAGGTNRVVLSSPLPFDFEWGCAYGRTYSWGLPIQCQSAGTYTQNNGVQTMPAFRQLQQQPTQVVNHAYSSWSSYNTNSNTNNNNRAWDSMRLDGLIATGFHQPSGVANIMNLQTTRSEDPIAAAITQYPESATLVNTNINNVFNNWRTPFGATPSSKFLNSPLVGWNGPVAYNIDPGNGLAGDLVPMGSSLDLFAPPTSGVNTLNSAPIYGTCYVELESRVKPYTLNGKTEWGVISFDDYSSTPSNSDRARQGERYKNQTPFNRGLDNLTRAEREHVFGLFRDIIRFDQFGPQRYDLYNPERNVRPFSPDPNWSTNPATRAASAEYAAQRVRCVAGSANRETAPSETNTTWPTPPTPTSGLTLPRAAVANGELSTTNISAEVRFGSIPAGVELDTRNSYAEFKVTVPSTFRYCSGTTTTNCDFKFTSTNTVSRSGNVITVRAPLTSTTTRAGLDMKFFRATPPSTRIQVQLSNIHTEFVVTGQQTRDPINVCLVGGDYGGAITGGGGCIRIVDAVDLRPTKRVVTDISPTGTASGNFPVVSATPLTR